MTFFTLFNSVCTKVVSLSRKCFQLFRCYAVWCTTLGQKYRSVSSQETLFREPHWTTCNVARNDAVAL